MLLGLKELIMKLQVLIRTCLVLELILLLRMKKRKNVKIDTGRRFIIREQHKMVQQLLILVLKTIILQKLLDSGMIRFLNVGILVYLSYIQVTKLYFIVLLVQLMEAKNKFLLQDKKYQPIQQLILKQKYQIAILYPQNHIKINNLELLL